MKKIKRHIRKTIQNLYEVLEELDNKDYKTECIRAIKHLNNIVLKTK